MFQSPVSKDEKKARLSALFLLRQTVAEGMRGSGDPMAILDERIANGDASARALKAKIETFRTDFAKHGPQSPAKVARGTVVRAVAITRKA